MSTRKIFLAPALLAAVVTSVAASAGTAQAQSVVSTGQSFLVARLLPGVLADGERIAGLEFAIAPGWKTYWRAPGEAGVPPRFDWSGSQNLRSIEVLWPRPEVFESFGMTTIGYGGVVVLPVRLVPEDPTLPIRIALALEVGVCADICVFEQAALVDDFPAELSLGEDAIARALGEVPASGEHAGVVRAECRIEGAGRDRRFSALLEMSTPPVSPLVVVEGTGEAWFHDVEVVQDGVRLAVSADLSLAADDQWITRSDVRMTVLAEDGASDIRGCSAMAG